MPVYIVNSLCVVKLMRKISCFYSDKPQFKIILNEDQFESKKILISSYMEHDVCNLSNMSYKLMKIKNQTGKPTKMKP